MASKSVTISLLAFASTALAAGAQTLLDPVRPILTPDGATSKNPLGHLGANGPWQPGPDVFDISTDVPEGCHIDQAAYVLRHGSRYPDPGAHSEWLDIVKVVSRPTEPSRRPGAGAGAGAGADVFAVKLKEKTYNATGPLAFLHDWDTPLSDPAIQIAQLSKTGYKELFDLGYTLRIRYPHLYKEGDDFYVWANQYTRVIQTAKLFVQGYLGANSTLGTVVSVAGKGFPEQLGNTLAPSDMCPTFVDDSSAQTNAWQSKWLPAYIERLSQYIEGDLRLTDSMWNLFPYICGFESQITGRLSHFCDTFTQEELEQYEYQQDLRYYYGVGPATKVASKLMVPFLDSLLERFAAGPDSEGEDFNGDKYKVPNLLMSFLNDGQLNQLVVASGIFDEQELLPTDRIPEDRLWVNSRISPMRGTIAFERLNCPDAPSPPVTTTRPCKPRPTGSTKPRPKHASAPESTFIRIRLNDAVYPLPSCQDGPGRSCSLRNYIKYVDNKNQKQGSLVEICNATDPATPTKIAGASFFTNLAQSHLEPIQV